MVAYVITSITVIFRVTLKTKPADVRIKCDYIITVQFHWVYLSFFPDNA